MKNQSSSLELSENTSCAIIGGSSLTTLSSKQEISKHGFYPKTVDEYINNLVDLALEFGKIKKGQKGSLVVALAGAVQSEGERVGLTENFRLVREDHLQRGMPYFFFKQLVEAELKERGYKEIEVFGYNDAVPAISAILCQENTEEVLSNFENELNLKGKDSYSIKYMINGTGTGEANLNPDTAKIITAEKGHLKPSLLWYELNPFFKFMSRFSVIGQNRSIERLIAGGPTHKSPRHFSRLFSTSIELLRKGNGNEQNELAIILGFENYEELVRADNPNNLLQSDINSLSENSPLMKLGSAVKENNRLALSFSRVFANALGSSFACMHYSIGEMPDSPLNTFIGINDIRHSALGFIRSDGSTTALLSSDPEKWQILNNSAERYASLISNKPNEKLFKILDINQTFPNIHPDFGGLPRLAAQKLLSIS